MNDNGSVKKPIEKIEESFLSLLIPFLSLTVEVSGGDQPSRSTDWL